MKITIFLLFFYVACIAQPSQRCPVCPPSLNGVTNGWVLTDSSGHAVWQKTSQSNFIPARLSTPQYAVVDSGGVLYADSNKRISGTYVFSKSNAVGTSDSGSTAETITYSVLVPANTIPLNSRIQIYFRAISDSIAADTIRIRTNTANSLVSSVLVATTTIATGSSSIISRQDIIQSTVSTWTLFPPTQSSITDLASSTGVSGISTLTFNNAVDNYMLFTIANTITRRKSNGIDYIITIVN